ncbi:AMP-binding protein [Parabacteroides sp. ZJ-118]|uniref:AMP-binding protein n=1 Tax=Parabacteroides sp. ZJ-118 TaxID=2709398 RepID=UPI0013EDDB16|nr:AMP-binding protein [Parabacteroides sp. ZJ-118]
MRNYKKLLGISLRNPEAVAAIDSYGKKLSYGEIIELSDHIEHNICPRSLFFILTKNNVGGVAWVMATILSGNVPLILSANIEPQLLENLIDTYHPQYICKPSDVTDGILGYKITATGEDKCEMHSELSHLLPTSGSTGSPKLVRHKYDNIEAAGLNISTFFRLTEADRPLMVLPLHYTMGLSMVFSHLKVGATILITDLSMTDARFWKFIKEEKATSFTGVPFSYEILDKMRFTRMNLPDLTLLTQGGGKMPAELNLKFVEYCCDNGKRWVATYGQSEGTARMAWLPEEYALSKMGSIGIAVPNGKLSLRDAEGREIKESPATGEMCYAGRNVTMGYARCPEDLVLGDERNGFLSTGDIAYRDEDGFYYIKGRMSRFLKIFGNRVGLDECDRIVTTAVNCQCACTGNDNRLIIYLTDISKAVRAKAAIVEAVHLPANVIEVRIIEELPKNETGKILFSKLNNK